MLSARLIWGQLRAILEAHNVEIQFIHLSNLVNYSRHFYDPKLGNTYTDRKDKPAVFGHLKAMPLSDNCLCSYSCLTRPPRAYSKITSRDYLWQELEECF